MSARKNYLDLQKYKNPLANHQSIKYFGFGRNSASMKFRHTAFNIFSDASLTSFDKTVLMKKLLDDEFMVESTEDEEEEAEASSKVECESDAEKLYRHVKTHMSDNSLYDSDRRVRVFNAAIMAFPDLSPGESGPWPGRERLNVDGTFKKRKINNQGFP